MAKFPNKPSRPVIDWKHPLTKGLVFDCPMLELGGSPIDLVTEKQGVRTGATGTVGKYGRALDFNSSGRSVEFTSHPLLSTFDHITLELAIKYDGSGGGNYGNAFNLGGSASSPPWFGVENDNGTSGWGIRLNCYYDSVERVWSFPYPGDSLWHHYVIRYDHTNSANTPVVYKDGVQQSVTSRWNAGWSETISVSHCKVGNSYYTGFSQYWGGPIAHCRLWKRLLTTKEMRDLYVNPFQFYKKSKPILGKAGAPPSTSVKDIIGGFGLIPFAR